MQVDTRVVWAAGYFDGEGCAYCYSYNGGRGYVKVSTCCRRSIRVFQELWGGKITRRGPRTSGSVVGKKPVYTWRVGGETASRFAQAVLSYSTEKREQLELLMQIPVGVWGRGRSILTPAQRRQRAAIIRKLKRLKR